MPSITWLTGKVHYHDLYVPSCALKINWVIKINGGGGERRIGLTWSCLRNQWFYCQHRLDSPIYLPLVDGCAPSPSINHAQIGRFNICLYSVASGSGILWIPWIVLEFFWYGNVLGKSQFFRLVLELFLNSEFLTSDFLGCNISGCPLFGSPICEKILFQFCRIICHEYPSMCSWKMWQMFLKCSSIVLEFL